MVGDEQSIPESRKQTCGSYCCAYENANFQKLFRIG